ncbi:MAG: response regulator [Tildeniella nuda ZEHNDER 1965/U140]|jgi:twitching motility two-component system response regulator PilG|nr:response regulator [Tildeniella nuda ZEHNDER 1965/U140]
MNTISMVDHKPSQKLHPLSLLAQAKSRQISGCLHVSSNAGVWSIYLDQGELIYASSSIDRFERLDRHLRQLSRQVINLVSPVRVQVRLLFESAPEMRSKISSDYRALCWLVEQQHLTSAQAAGLIEELAKEVIESFLLVQEGSYELIEKEKFDEFPSFYRLDLRPLVEFCQERLRQQRVAKPLVPSPSNRPDFVAQKRGTQASTVINLSPGDSSAAVAAANKKDRPPENVSLKATYTIVCVDDSPTVLQAINSFLDDTSFAIVMVNDPVRALMQVVRSKPDLVLLDVEMPNLDGYELCSLLRRHPTFRNTPIIMVTGNTGFIDRAKAKLVGASGYLTKPFTQSDLLKIVFKHLSC